MVLTKLYMYVIVFQYNFQNHEAVVKALAEDPSVFEYDNIYDDLQEKKKKSDPRLQKKDNRVCEAINILTTVDHEIFAIKKFSSMTKIKHAKYFV